MSFELIPYARLIGPEWNPAPDEILKFIGKGLLTPYSTHGGIFLPAKLIWIKDRLVNLSAELRICDSKLERKEYTLDEWRRETRRRESEIEKYKSLMNEHSEHLWQSNEFSGDDYENESDHLKGAFFKRDEVEAIETKDATRETSGFQLTSALPSPGLQPLCHGKISVSS